MTTKGTGEELLWRVGSATNSRPRRAMIAWAVVFLAAAGGKLAWDARSASMPIELARLVAGGDETQKQIAAVVTLLRESSDNIEALQAIERSSDPKVAEQARIALGHLRRQLAR